MSFSLPRHVPSFDNSQRGLENGYWGSSGISRTQNGHTGNGLGGKLDGFLDKRRLPMYKDKPYSYAASGRSRRWYKRRRTLGGVVLGILGLAYWLGVFSSVEKVAPGGSPRAPSWPWDGKSTRSKVDWDGRREKVKEAFMLSWDGYEKHAWGTLK